MFLGEVCGLGAIDVGVVELPFILIEVSLANKRGVQRRSFLTVLPDPAAAEQGIVLALLLGWGVFCIKGLAHGDA